MRCMHNLQIADLPNPSYFQNTYNVLNLTIYSAFCYSSLYINAWFCKFKSKNLTHDNLFGNILTYSWLLRGTVKWYRFTSRMQRKSINNSQSVYFENRWQIIGCNFHSEDKSQCHTCSSCMHGTRGFDACLASITHYRNRKILCAYA